MSEQILAGESVDLYQNAIDLFNKNLRFGQLPSSKFKPVVLLLHFSLKDIIYLK